ncbi:hypothetical protein M513_08346 [Trichuris suis]|uniref:Uncharacterized protein n=1 Tax=Trichuris suis TaxID=68888 RepID=A0A085M0Q9_9BILA|nr:hypothetical protein M513_08346 [Trichuris suis]
MIVKSAKLHRVTEDLILSSSAKILELILAISRIPIQFKEKSLRWSRSLKIRYAILKNTEFTKQLDEPALPWNKAEFLLAKELVIDTKGESTFDKVKEFFKEKQITALRTFWRLLPIEYRRCRLLLDTEARRLSKGARLTQFYELFGSVIQLFEEHDVSVFENLRKSKMDTTYLADL